MRPIAISSCTACPVSRHEFNLDTFSLSASEAHWIDDIQKNLSDCRQENSTQVLYDLGMSGPPLENRELVRRARGPNGECPNQLTSRCLDLLFPNSTPDGISVGRGGEDR